MMSNEELDRVQAKIDSGDEALDADDFTRAASEYRLAVALIPEPQFAQVVSLPAYTALGEAYLFGGKYLESLAALGKAMKAPGGVGNPLLHLRLGQAHYEAGDLDRAADSLTRAYALDGKDVFNDEDEKYIAFLATRIDMG